MATPQEKLAQSLKILQDLQKDTGSVAIRARDITRTHRERLLDNAFIQEVMKGWYIPTRPDEQPGDSTSWYTSYWNFCSSYLEDRFGKEWIVSPEQSIKLQTGNWSVPPQLIIRSPKAQNNNTTLPYNTSLFDVKVKLPDTPAREVIDGLRVYTLSKALILIPESSYRGDTTDIRTALSMITDASDILPELLDGGHTVVAGRLAGAFRNIGNDRIADDIIKAMRSAGYESQENDPFETRMVMPAGRSVSKYVRRIQTMWKMMREPIVDLFPEAPGLTTHKEGYLKQVKDAFVTDAYHSLSIEGYRVTPALIQRVAENNWNPDENETDREARNAMSARGYWQAFQVVLKSLEKILDGANPGEVADRDHGDWYRELFAPSVTAGILKPSDLAGYRNGQVYIRRSMYVPLNRDAVRDAMPAFFELLANEENPGTRVVLGHFIFVYIHPYMDGNGRMARFLTNLMLAASGYPWTVVPLERRDPYMDALEQASVHQNIVPFAEVLSHLVRAVLKGEPIAKI